LTRRVHDISHRNWRPANAAALSPRLRISRRPWSQLPPWLHSRIVLCGCSMRPARCRGKSLSIWQSKKVFSPTPKARCKACTLCSRACCEASNSGVAKRNLRASHHVTGNQASKGGLIIRIVDCRPSPSKKISASIRHEADLRESRADVAK